MKLLSIVGARPQFVKAAALSKRLADFSNIEEKIIHTGQHFDAQMSHNFFTDLDIPEPWKNLNIHSLSHGAMTGRMLEKLEVIFATEQPDYVLVYGDTNSTLAAALAAAKLHIPVAHVEAGLRSFNPKMPEEINRVVTDRLSELLFCPTEKSRQNLLKEGIDPQKIKITGDIMLDAVQWFGARVKAKSENQNYALLTLHRQENVDNPQVLKKLIKIINKLAQSTNILLPLHPRTKAKLDNYTLNAGVRVVSPLGYLQMLAAIKGCDMVLTDSGGLQKEAFYLGKYCLTLRNETEWTELVDLGVNKICGSNPEVIEAAYHHFAAQAFPEVANPYGNGDAAGKIIETITSHEP